MLKTIVKMMEGKRLAWHEVLAALNGAAGASDTESTVKSQNPRCTRGKPVADVGGAPTVLRQLNLHAQ